jgi:hypothetical protein
MASTKTRDAIVFSVFGAVIVALLSAWAKRNREIVGAVPIVGDMFNYVMPDSGGFRLPGITIPGLTLPPVQTLQTVMQSQENSRGGNYPPANSCGCGTSTREELVINFSPNPSRPPPMFDPVTLPAYSPPPCIQQTDYNALTAIGTTLGDWLRGPRGLKSKHFAELQNAGYPPSVAGWAKYVVEMPRGINGNQNRTADRANILNLAKNFQRCM